VAGIDNKSNHICIALAIWTMVSLNFVGCAGRNASSAMLVRERNITSQEIEAVAQGLVATSLQSPGFSEVAQGAAVRGNEITISLMSFTNHTADLSWSGRSGRIRELFIAIEEQFAKNNLYFRKESDPNLPDYINGMDQVSPEPSTDRGFSNYDQSGLKLDRPSPKEKLVLGLELEVFQITNSTPQDQILEFKFIARIINKKTNKTLCVATEKVQK